MKLRKIIYIFKIWIEVHIQINQDFNIFYLKLMNINKIIKWNNEKEMTYATQSVAFYYSDVNSTDQSRDTES